MQENSLNTLGLQLAISQNLTSEELNSICEQLGVDVAELDGTGLVAKAYSLVDLMEQSAKVPELIEKLSQLRPSVFRQSEFSNSDSTILVPPDLISVTPAQSGARIVQLKPAIDNPQATVLLRGINDLEDRIILLPYPSFQERIYDRLKTATQLLLTPTSVPEESLLQLTHAEYLVRTSRAEVFRAEQLQQIRIKQAQAQRLETARQARDEKTLSWTIPLILLVYLVAGLVLFFFLYGATAPEYVIPLIDLPIQILVWATLGSYVALLVRYYRRQEATTVTEEIRIYIGQFLVGIIAGCFAYLVISSGLGVVTGSTIDWAGATTVQKFVLSSLVAVVALRESVFDNLIARVTGNVTGGEPSDAIKSVSHVDRTEIARIIAESNQPILEEIEKLEAQVRETREVMDELATGTNGSDLNSALE